MKKMDRRAFLAALPVLSAGRPWLPLAWAPMESGEDALRRVREHGDRQTTQTE